MQHEAPVRDALERIELLLVARRAERGGDDSLRLTTREQRAAVDAGEQAALDGDRAHRRGVAAVDAATRGEHLLAHRHVLEVLVGLLDLLLLVGAELRHERRDDRLLHLLEGVVALRLVRDVARGDGAIEAHGLHAIGKADRLGGRLELPLRDVRRLAHLLDELDGGLHRALAEVERLHEVLLGHLAGLALDHHDRVLAGRDHELAVALLDLGEGRVRDELAVDARDADATDRARPRNGRHVQRGRGAEQREHVARVLAVEGENRRDDLDLVAVALGEEGARRAIDETRDEDLGVLELALALEEATGDLARGERLLDVLHAEREEVDAGARLGGAAHGDEHDGLATGHEAGALRLLRDASGLEGDDAVTDLHGLTDELGHYERTSAGDGPARRDAHVRCGSGCAPARREGSLGPRLERAIVVPSGRSVVRSKRSPNLSPRRRRRVIREKGTAVCERAGREEEEEEARKTESDEPYWARRSR